MRTIGAIAMAVFIFQLVISQIASAMEMEISNAFARASAGAARNGAIYLTIKNRGQDDDVLASVSADVSRRAELHGHSMNDNIMRMRQIKEGILVSAGSTVQLKPGGFHLMLLELKSPLKKGGQIAVTLTFKNAGKIEINIPVLGVGSKPAM
jgi:copper(I)-binding protein